MTSRPSHTRRTAGFTIIEMIAAMAIFAILVLMVTTIVSNTQKIIARNTKTMDSDSQARTVFDRMQSDVFSLARRADLDVVFASLGGNDRFFFFSTAPAYYDSSLYTTASQSDPKNRLSLVGYRINSTTNQMERLGLGLKWDGAPSASTPGSAVFLSSAADGTLDANSTMPEVWPSYVGRPPGFDGSDTTYWQTLAPQVFRMEICFLLTDGTLSTKPILTSVVTQNNAAGSGAPTAANGSPSYAAGSRWFDATGKRAYVCVDSTTGSAVWVPLGTRDLQAIIVAIAVLDARSAKLTSASKIPALAAELADVTDSDLTGASPTLMQQKWQAVVQTSSFASSAGVPAPVGSAVRIYQRYLYLNSP